MKWKGLILYGIISMLCGAPAIGADAIKSFHIQSPPWPSPDPILIAGPTKDTLGWSFRPLSEMQLTDLGFYDADGDGLLVSHHVGVWNSAGGLLADVFVPAGNAAALQGAYRYVAVPLLTLLPGETYVIGATAQGLPNFKGLEVTVFDSYPLYDVDPATLVVDSNLSLLSFRRFIAPEDGLPQLPPGDLNYPPLDILNEYTLAPNFQFNLVPEPGSLLSLSLLSLFLAARKNRSKARNRHATWLNSGDTIPIFQGIRGTQYRYSITHCGTRTYKTWRGGEPRATSRELRIPDAGSRIPIPESRFPAVGRRLPFWQFPCPPFPRPLSRCRLAAASDQ